MVGVGVSKKREKAIGGSGFEIKDLTKEDGEIF